MSRVEVVIPGQEVRVPGGVRFRREVEARRSRHRLYPVSILYTVFTFVVGALALASDHKVAALRSFLVGSVVWTLIEYLAHRHILHGRFPDGPGIFRHFLHKTFDHLHWEHHKRPWDGNHINGTIKDTLPFAGPIALLSFLAPLWSLPVFVAGILQAYVIEEWVHHCVHFYQFDNLYFRYIKRHHLYHHSPMGMNIAFGLTNGFWDVVHDTRIPPPIRRALYAPLRAARQASPSPPPRSLDLAEHGR